MIVIRVILVSFALNSENTVYTVYRVNCLMSFVKEWSGLFIRAFNCTH